MKLYFALDVETTGLNYEDEIIVPNRLLQIAYQILNEDLEVFYKGSYYIKDKHTLNELWGMNPYVFNMHCSTGLIQALQEGKGYDCNYIEGKILRELDELKQSLEVDRLTVIPLGNNVQFDVEVIRRHMPELFSKFHYSFLDVSCIRNAFSFVNKEFAPIIYDIKGSNHNAEIDIAECVKELKIYKELLCGIPHICNTTRIKEEIIEIYDNE